MNQDATGGRWLKWAGVVAASAAVVAGAMLTGPQLLQSEDCGPTSVLRIFAREAFDWSSSTTPAPLSTTAVLVKAILGGKTSARELGLEKAVLSSERSSGSERAADVKVGTVRDLISSRILQKVTQLCSPAGDSSSSSSSSSSRSACDPNEVDPEFGTSPLHLAELWGSSELVHYLLSIGASPDTFDTVGRQPRNMTFKAFSANSKKAADARLSSLDPTLMTSADSQQDARCEIPEVVIPLFPQDGNVATSESVPSAEEQDERWRTEALAALNEVRRLVSEGEPVMVRNVVPWLERQQSREEGRRLRYHDAASFAEAWGHRPVDVGGVPYAKNFDLFNEETVLKDYISSTVGVIAAASGGGDGDPAAAVDSTSRSSPNYVFQVDTEACAEGYELMARIVDAALPSSGDKPIVCPPPSGLRGLQSVHYYLGGRWSGAPFHIHSDALNLAVSGKKKWWVVPPRSAVWSRRHIREYAEEGKGGPADGEERPMECVQRGGDLVYVPGDWGHAAMNLDGGTFGYTLELVNRRDTLASVLGKGCEQ